MRSVRAILIIGMSIGATLPLPGQNQVLYTGINATGELILSRTVNLRQAQSSVAPATVQGVQTPEEVPKVRKRLGPPLSAQVPLSVAAPALPPMQSLSVVSGPAPVGFNGLSHLDQRTANGGNQFSVEPPNPSVAIGNGFILEGVNNAIQVYDLSGNPLLPVVLSSNQLFGLAAEINRTSGVNGVFPTDMRVFFDPDISRWFVLQRAQDNDASGNPLNSSHIYLAVSQSSDPTQTYNIYTADTTNAANPGCPCISDYLQIGADQYGFYISANEYNAASQSSVDARILAISKASLAAGVNAPTASKFTIRLSQGYEFAIQPATTPPGASYFSGNGGLEYFASTLASSTATGDHVAIWAMFNTSSLATGNPNPTLIENSFPTLTYSYPATATQPPGNRPYGLSLNPPGPLPLIDGGDIRALSLSYAGGQLYMTFATQVSDESGRSLAGGAYVVLSPTVSNGVLAAPVLRQGYLVVNNNHLLRPMIAVNAQGRGAIAATVVGPDWYPSAAFVPFDTVAAPSIIQIASAGTLPEDGFTGYSGGLAPAIARWGDYSSAAVASDGSVWMVAEYIGNLPRTQFANWDTFVMSLTPDCTYQLNLGGQAFSAAGGTGSVTVTTAPGCPWSVGRLPNGITLTSPASGNGSGTVTFAVPPNSGVDMSGLLTIAGQTFTIEQQADSIPGLNFIGSMAHLAGEENWTTAFTLVNKGGASATARLSLFGDANDPTGNGPLWLPLAFPQQVRASGPLLAASFDRTLAANATLIAETAGAQTPPVLVGSAQLASTGAVDGFAIFHHTVTLQEAVTPMETRNAGSYLLAFDNTEDMVLGVAVENVAASTAIIPVVIRDENGVVISAPGSSISVQGNGHIHFVLSDSVNGFPVTANIRGTIEFDTPAGGQISVLGLRFTPPNNALTTIPVLANVGAGGGSIAHLASGGDGWKTTFVLINTGSSGEQFTLSFFADQTGAPLSLPLSFPQPNGGTPTLASSVTQNLPAGATRVIVSTGAVNLLTGSAQLTTLGHISGFVIFRHNNQEAVVPLESRNAGGYLIAFDNTGGTATGIAVNAVSTGPVNIPVTVRDDAGVPIATDTITLSANGHYAFTLATNRYPATANIRGTIEFDTPAGAQIGALGIRIPTGAAHTYTTLPALAK